MIGEGDPKRTVSKNGPQITFTLPGDRRAASRGPCRRSCVLKLLTSVWFSQWLCKEQSIFFLCSLSCQHPLQHAHTHTHTHTHTLQCLRSQFSVLFFLWLLSKFGSDEIQQVLFIHTDTLYHDGHTHPRPILRTCGRSSVLYLQTPSVLTHMQRRSQVISPVGSHIKVYQIDTMFFPHTFLLEVCVLWKERKARRKSGQLDMGLGLVCDKLLLSRLKHILHTNKCQ